MTEQLTKNADTALVEIKELLYERLTELRRIQKDFQIKSRQEDLWQGIVGQCGNEERFLGELLDIIERT
jgi:hypothetical protein